MKISNEAKKSFFIILFLPLIFSNFTFAQFQVEKVEIHFFYSPTCPHCDAEKTFLENLEKKYSQLEIKKYIAAENFDLLNKFYKNYSVPSEIQGFVPITFIKEQYFFGFNKEIGQDIENYLSGLTPLEKERKIYLPILGEVDVKKYSLPALAVIFGFLDGFDVCSLAALVLILGIVLASQSRAKVLFFGGVFILINAFIYGLLIMFWLKVFNFLGLYLRKMEILFGVLAIGGGIYFLRKFLKFKKESPVCEVETGWGKGIISKFAKEIKELFKTGKVLYIILGLLIFDIVLSVIEFPCSAALPVVFAGILSGAGLSSFQYFLYLAIFLLFYLLDEIIVFLIAVLTMKIWIASPKFITFFNLIASILLFLLGFYYLFGLI